MSSSNMILGRTVTATKDIHAEMTCYSLPYGALGFVSHLLTYYTIFCLWEGRRPLWPKRYIKYITWELSIGLVGLLVSSIMAIITLVRCRRTWQLLTIAIWKLCLSVVNGGTALYVGVVFVRARRKLKQTQNLEKQQRETEARDRSVGQHNTTSAEDLGEEECEIEEKIRKELKDNNSISLMYIYIHPRDNPIVGLILEVSNRANQPWDPASVPAGTFIIFIAFSLLLTDWVLAVLTMNLGGAPSGDNAAFYWTYFIAKRLPMASF
ncbi:hypothetical protein BDN72DRAFT_898396 [Pluteus cervinus]|uniref:Uncharacterized protein n=1 Tax=Pluteus cervinus TaxID=181527 RepID=A0ACD3AT84_9AGAR|nr:hypothetical protein BDN72DRAFT_898396 [Pluteus cervinus]